MYSEDFTFIFMLGIFLCFIFEAAREIRKERKKKDIEDDLVLKLFKVIEGDDYEAVKLFLKKHPSFEYKGKERLLYPLLDLVIYKILVENGVIVGSAYHVIKYCDGEWWEDILGTFDEDDVMKYTYIRKYNKRHIRHGLTERIKTISENYEDQESLVKKIAALNAMY